MSSLLEPPSAHRSAPVVAAKNGATDPYHQGGRDGDGLLERLKKSSPSRPQRPPRRRKGGGDGGEKSKEAVAVTRAAGAVLVSSSLSSSSGAVPTAAPPRPCEAPQSPALDAVPPQKVVKRRRRVSKGKDGASSPGRTTPVPSDGSATAPPKVKRSNHDATAAILAKPVGDAVTAAPTTVTPPTPTTATTTAAAAPRGRGQPRQRKAGDAAAATTSLARAGTTTATVAAAEGLSSGGARAGGSSPKPVRGPEPARGKVGGGRKAPGEVGAAAPTSQDAASPPQVQAHTTEEIEAAVLRLTQQQNQLQQQVEEKPPRPSNRVRSKATSSGSHRSGSGGAKSGWGDRDRAEPPPGIAAPAGGDRGGLPAGGRAGGVRVRSSPTGVQPSEAEAAVAAAPVREVAAAAAAAAAASTVFGSVFTRIPPGGGGSPPSPAAVAAIPLTSPPIAHGGGGWRGAETPSLPAFRATQGAAASPLSKLGLSVHAPPFVPAAREGGARPSVISTSLRDDSLLSIHSSPSGNATMRVSVLPAAAASPPEPRAVGVGLVVGGLARCHSVSEHSSQRTPYLQSPTETPCSVGAAKAVAVAVTEFPGIPPLARLVPSSPESGRNTRRSVDGSSSPTGCGFFAFPPSVPSNASSPVGPGPAARSLRSVGAAAGGGDVDVDNVMHRRVAFTDAEAKDERVMLDGLHTRPVEEEEEEEEEVTATTMTTTTVVPVYLAVGPAAESAHAAASADLLAAAVGSGVFRDPAHGAYWGLEGPHAESATVYFRGGGGPASGSSLVAHAEDDLRSPSGLGVGLPVAALESPMLAARSRWAAARAVDQFTSDGASDGVEDIWEVNSSAYEDSLDEEEVAWVEAQVRAKENPSDFFF